MEKEPPYHLDVDGLTDSQSTGSESGSVGTRRPWVGVHFDCCGVYTRIYRNMEGTAYIGRCPRCTRQIRLGVGANGTDARFFVAE